MAQKRFSLERELLVETLVGGVLVVPVPAAIETPTHRTTAKIVVRSRNNLFILHLRLIKASMEYRPKSYFYDYSFLKKNKFYPVIIEE